MPTNKDYTRLPQWVQTELRVAAMRVEEAEEKAATLFSTTPTNTVWWSGTIGQPLPDFALIRFYLGTGPADFINVRIERHGLYINGQRRILVRPEATNVVRIYLEPLLGFREDEESG